VDIEKSYDILGLSRDATLIEIKYAYRAKVKENHPDLVGPNPSLQKEADDRMKEINIAYRKILEFSTKSQSKQGTKQRSYPDETTRQKETEYSSGESFNKKPHRSSGKKPYQPFKNNANQTIRAEKGFLAQLMALIVESLSRIDLKHMMPGQKPGEPVANKRKTAFTSPKMNFDDILKDILKEGVYPGKTTKGRQGKTRYYQNMNQQTQTKKSQKEQGPVSGIKPVSRVKGVYRDR